MTDDRETLEDRYAAMRGCLPDDPIDPESPTVEGSATISVKELLHYLNSAAEVTEVCGQPERAQGILDAIQIVKGLQTGEPGNHPHSTRQ